LTLREAIARGSSSQLRSPHQVAQVRAFESCLLLVLRRFIVVFLVASYHKMAGAKPRAEHVSEVSLAEPMPWLAAADWFFTLNPAV
jgi:hypothetical protein